jgi:hypothetical protein
MARTQPCWELTYSLNALAGTLNGAGRITRPAAEAAAIWAGAPKPYPEMVDSLNRKAGNHLPNYLDLNGVCNQLAGTTGLDAQDALSRLAGN